MLILAYLTPYVPPKNFSYLAILSLAIPVLIISNLFFLMYWMLNLKIQLVLSLFALLVGLNHAGSLYKFSNSKNIGDNEAISIMNYNVRLFNLYNWIDNNYIQKNILKFIKKESPDIISFQEYTPHESIDLSFYKYKYEVLSGNRVKYGQAILSKFPIINSGSIQFPNTANNAIYIDIKKDIDTLRVYNIHLQSLRIDTQKEELTKENSSRLLKRTRETFAMQQNQTELFLKHKSNSPYKIIICGDFNNTAYSYVYKKIKGNLVDTFTAAGKGFGRTFNFKYFPVRIDFILVDETFTINDFMTFNNKYSDHFPILSRLSLHK